jgi:vacuolar-type H+-ATPase subunit H
LQKGSAIEETVKALTEFESELEGAKALAEDSIKKMVKEAGEWAASARADAAAKSQEMASHILAKARADAEAEAVKIKEKGEGTLRALESSLSKRRRKAKDHVVSRLMGGSP